ncbi:mitochondrial ribosomal protein L27 precursor, putative [Plasmodium vinckei brucechwatti]|uniref:Mitochondrial ribosomal protein L27, putative n=1 Tax=Plasmodium vinckei brucechwatti TaxID=119398 RepID=A0A6V7RXA8_PLAVN|nr:mitochondrial ribosomal protein L27 precursor, putative [Plasmodium vinckei brucechwatti]
MFFTSQTFKHFNNLTISPLSKIQNVRKNNSIVAYFNNAFIAKPSLRQHTFYTINNNIRNIDKGGIKKNSINKKNICTSNILSTHFGKNMNMFINCLQNVNYNIWNYSNHFTNNNGTDFIKIFKRNKMVKTSSYRRKSRSSPNGQGQKAKIGIKRLSGEYVQTGQLLVKQRKIIAFNYEKKTRKRNFKYYPGENVKVAKNTSLISLTNGRVKYTFHVLQNILIVNVIPEELEELHEDDLYRYRTEHIKSFEENRSLIYLRMKNIITFPKFKNTQYIKPPIKPQFLTKYDIYDNPTLKEVPILYHKKD